MIALLWRTGAKISEVLNVEVGDVDLTPGGESVLLAGLELTERTVGLDPLAVYFVRGWIAERCTMPGVKLLCVVEGPTAGESWQSTDVRRSLRKLTRQVHRDTETQFKDPPSPSDFRVTMVAELVLEQWPLPYIQTQLGLTTLETFRVLIPQLGIEPADAAEVAEIARTRPQPEFER
jgi:integrase